MTGAHRRIGPLQHKRTWTVFPSSGAAPQCRNARLEMGNDVTSSSRMFGDLTKKRNILKDVP
ncbi:MAG TPA: hypothetical protein VIX60_03820 [Candidatus Cybelea sp.]